MIAQSVADTVREYCGFSEYPDDWNLKGLIEYVNKVYTTPENPLSFTDDEFERLTKDSLTNIITDMAEEKYEKKEQEIGSEMMRHVERIIMLNNVDEKWMDHIDAMDQLKNGISLRA